MLALSGLPPGRTGLLFGLLECLGVCLFGGAVGVPFVAEFPEDGVPLVSVPVQVVEYPQIELGLDVGFFRE